MTNIVSSQHLVNGELKLPAQAKQNMIVDDVSVVLTEERLLPKLTCTYNGIFITDAYFVNDGHLVIGFGNNHTHEAPRDTVFIAYGGTRIGYQAFKQAVNLSVTWAHSNITSCPSRLGAGYDDHLGFGFNSVEQTNEATPIPPSDGGLLFKYGSLIGIPAGYNYAGSLSDDIVFPVNYPSELIANYARFDSYDVVKTGNTDYVDEANASGDPCVYASQLMGNEHGWRLPTATECRELYNSLMVPYGHWQNNDNESGWLFGTNVLPDNAADIINGAAPMPDGCVFLPAYGCLQASDSWTDVEDNGDSEFDYGFASGMGTKGYYWCRDGSVFSFDSGQAYDPVNQPPLANNQNAYSVRCVRGN
jgi:hypothetical protein